MKPYPLTFHPILKPTVWGGRNLQYLGKSLPADTTIGESWEIADVTTTSGTQQSVIANGPLAGITLHDAITQHRDLIMGSYRPPAPHISPSPSTTTPDHCPQFPLLIKYLDAQQNLSVQVHPSPAYAAAHPNSPIKHEAWVILHAEPGAVIYLGLKKGVTRQDLLSAIQNRHLAPLLNAIPVSPGQCFHIPSGTVHALGAGITLAEVQTTSDCTFRIHDWGREYTPDARQMHIDQALQCIDFSADPLGPAPASLLPPIVVDNIHTQPLAETPDFSIQRIDALDDAAIDIVTSGIPEVWMVLAGQGQIHSHAQPILDIHRGMTLLMPAALSEPEPATASVKRSTSILRITLPSPVKGMIA